MNYVERVRHKKVLGRYASGITPTASSARLLRMEIRDGNRISPKGEVRRWAGRTRRKSRT